MLLRTLFQLGLLYTWLYLGHFVNWFFKINMFLMKIKLRNYRL